MVSLDEFHCSLLTSDVPGLNRSVILFQNQVPLPQDIPGPWIFVPDLHLLSADQGEKYTHQGQQYYHLGNSAEETLVALLWHLIELKADPGGGYADLKVVQLGDFHDLWREKRHFRADSVRKILMRQLEDHRTLLDLFRELSADRVIGNHEDALESDRAAQENSDIWPAERMHREPMILDLDREVIRMLVLHGHQVDKHEKGIRRYINPPGARMVRFRWISDLFRDEWEYELGPDHTTPPPPEPIPQTEVHYRELPRSSLFHPLSEQEKTQAKRQKYYVEIKKFAIANTDVLVRGGAEAKVAVIGHTHHPRIVVGEESDYQLLDGGSWVNRAVSGDSKERKTHFWNAQIGVLAQDRIAVIQIA